MKVLLHILILVFWCDCNVYSQDNEVLKKDTLVSGEMFHVIIYTDTHRVACVGQYVPNTQIRTGEWDYFYADGKIYSKTWFKMDTKTGLWIYYDENGNIEREENYRKRIHFADADIKPIASVYYDDLQQDKEARQEADKDIRQYLLDRWIYDVFRYIPKPSSRYYSRADAINELSPFPPMATTLYNNTVNFNLHVHVKAKSKT